MAEVGEGVIFPARRKCLMFFPDEIKASSGEELERLQTPILF